MEAASCSSSLRVVVVDDSPQFRAMMMRALCARPRIEVVGYAQSGPEAVEQVSRLRPDVVLMDIAMPGISGIEATRQIKSQPDAPLVILLTFYDTAQHRSAAASVGVDHFISKSELHTQLWPLLQSLLTQRSPVSG
ncbi:MAG TPA: response regulator transcription factor [Methylomirabilota bacterium]|jgi:DNA-binding NarL/FixJ family response regulator|nr:response regulator transcription factor [Methylomirabilota bacterium]